jgi:hypothetical protein
VYAVIQGVRVAFEVQVSTLTLDDLARRTASYAREGVAVCWMHPYSVDGIGAGTWGTQSRQDCTAKMAHS